LGRGADSKVLGLICRTFKKKNAKITLYLAHLKEGYFLKYTVRGPPPRVLEGACINIIALKFKASLVSD
jgi:hypothetical protein